MDWGTIGSTLVGAIVGFLSTAITSAYLKRQNIKKMIEKLRMELKDNRDKLSKTLNDPETIIEFKSPIWELVTTSEILLDIKPDIYIKIINSYLLIKKLSSSEKKISAKDAEDRATQRKIIEEREKILKELDKNMI